MDSQSLIDKAILEKSIPLFWFLNELSTLVNKADNIDKLENYFQTNNDYKKAIDLTLGELIKKIEKIEKGKKGKNVKPFHNRIGNGINFHCLMNLEDDLFEITQKPVGSVMPDNIDYLSNTKGSIRFLISPKQKMLAIIEHQGQNDFDKCCLFKYSLTKGEFSIEPYGDSIQGIMEVYPNNLIIIYMSTNGELLFWDCKHNPQPYIENTPIYKKYPLLANVLSYIG